LRAAFAAGKTFLHSLGQKRRWRKVRVGKADDQREIAVGLRKGRPRG